MKIVFITDLDYLTYEHYLKQPWPMIERKICQITHKNPNLIKTLNKMPSPYRNHLIASRWGVENVYDGNIRHTVIPANWMDIAHNTIT